MDNVEIKEKPTAEVAEAKVNEGKEAASVGKFKNVDALLEAYLSLEAEFTRRSQKLKELEKANKERTTPEQPTDLSATALTANAETVEGDTASVQTPSQGQKDLTGESLIEAVSKDPQARRAIISEYLENTLKKKGVPFITGGVNIPAQRKTPATVKEAGKLAEKLFKN